MLGKYLIKSIVVMFCKRVLTVCKIHNKTFMRVWDWQDWPWAGCWGSGMDK